MKMSRNLTIKNYNKKRNIDLTRRFKFQLKVITFIMMTLCLRNSISILLLKFKTKSRSMNLNMFEAHESATFRIDTDAIKKLKISKFLIWTSCKLLNVFRKHHDWLNYKIKINKNSRRCSSLSSWNDVIVIIDVNSCNIDSIIKQKLFALTRLFYYWQWLNV